MLKKKDSCYGYMFPPFVEIGEQGKVSGLTLDLIDALNKIQSEYHFEFYLTSSKRRYKDFQNKNLIPFLRNDGMGLERFSGRCV